MKLVISDEGGGAHTFIRQGLARAFSAFGIESAIWNIKQLSPMDMIDRFQPDILMTQSYNLTPGIIKAIAEQPLLRVVLRAADRSPYAEEVKKEFPILTASENEIRLVNELREKTGKPHFLHNHYTQESIERTHADWIGEGFKVKSLLSAADPFIFYGGDPKPEYESDIAFCGSRWDYKARTIDPYILQFCNPNYSYNVKIFGLHGWGCSQYCGPARDEELKHILRSAKICPNVSEMHSQKYGYDIVERPWKLAMNKCFCISDGVADLKKEMPMMIQADSPQDFKDKVDYYLDKPEERETIINDCFNHVIQHHTYFDRVNFILNELDLFHENLGEVKKKVFGENVWKS